MKYSTNELLFIAKTKLSTDRLNNGAMTLQLHTLLPDCLFFRTTHLPFEIFIRGILSLTPWSEVLLEKLILSQLVRMLPPFTED
jgi:hypothetical protein